MSDFVIGRFCQNKEIYNNSNTSSPKSEDAVVWQNPNPVNPEEKAKELGYKKTKYQNAFYDKKTKTYHKWDAATQSFSPTELKDLWAEKYGLQKTKNPNLYYGEESETYYKWRNGSMTPEKVSEMYDSGAYKRASNDGSISMIYDIHGNWKHVDGEEVFYGRANNQGRMNPEEILGFELEVSGYIETFQKGVYCDKSEQNFYIWNSEKNTFEPTTAPKMPSFEPEPTPVEEVKPPTIAEIAAKKADGVVDNFEQSKQTGDCWLVSTIYGLQQNEAGRALLEEIVQVSENGDVTINLKGANKSYTFTNAEIEEAQAKGAYANGDKDVVAMEMAVEKYRYELVEIKQKARESNIINPKGVSGNPYRADYSKMYIDRPLDGGTHVTALVILTGKGSQHIMSSGYEGLHIVNHTRKIGGFNEETLKQYMDNPNQLTFASIKLPEGQHGVYVASTDDENVYIVDPHDTSKPKPIPKEEFYANLLALTTTDLSSEPEARLQKSWSLETINTPEAQEYIDKWKAQEE